MGIYQFFNYEKEVFFGLRNLYGMHILEIQNE